MNENTAPDAETPTSDEHTGTEADAERSELDHVADAFERVDEALAALDRGDLDGAEMLAASLDGEAVAAIDDDGPTED
jgi:hypothetical protein